MSRLVRQVVAQLISIFVLFLLLMYCLVKITIVLTPVEERSSLPAEFAAFMDQSNSSSGVFGLVLILFAARAVAEGKKEKILFLRPFNSSANEIIMGSVAKRVGNKFTLIALDDGSVPAPRFSLGEFVVGMLVFLPSGTILLIFALANLRPNLPDRLQDPSMASYDASVISDVATQMFLQMLVVWLALSIIWKSIRLVMPSVNRMNIRSGRDLRKATKIVKRLARWSPRFFSPRSLIFLTSDELWQPAVVALAKECWLVIVDVSRFTKSVEWEIEYLNREKRRGYIIMLNGASALPQKDFLLYRTVLRYEEKSRTHTTFIRSLQRVLRNRLAQPAR